ncbi:hypothetical protein TNCV_4270061 [Trichonephila clavipes]|nr:hypothetical protein TNCV_4270061 [Trichonephila clavipes]
MFYKHRAGRYALIYGFAEGNARAAEGLCRDREMHRTTECLLICIAICVDMDYYDKIGIELTIDELIEMEKPRPKTLKTGVFRHSSMRKSNDDWEFDRRPQLN